MATYMVQLLIGDYEIVDGGDAGRSPLTNVALHGRRRPHAARTSTAPPSRSPTSRPCSDRSPSITTAWRSRRASAGWRWRCSGRSMFSRDDFDGSVNDRTRCSNPTSSPTSGSATPSRPAEWRTSGSTNRSPPTASGCGSITPAASISRRPRPGSWPPPGSGDPTGRPSDAEDLFGFDRYDGGAVVLHALRHEIGDDAFFALLQRWVAENSGTSRTTADFVAFAAEVAGRDPDVVLRRLAVRAGALPSTFPG